MRAGNSTGSTHPLHEQANPAWPRQRQKARRRHPVVMLPLRRRAAIGLLGLLSLAGVLPSIESTDCVVTDPSDPADTIAVGTLRCTTIIDLVLPTHVAPSLALCLDRRHSLPPGLIDIESNTVMMASTPPPFRWRYNVTAIATATATATAAATATADQHTAPLHPDLSPVLGAGTASSKRTHHPMASL